RDSQRGEGASAYHAPMEKGTLTPAGVTWEGPPDNDEATEAWSGVLFERFVQFRDLIVTGLAQHGSIAMEMYPPHPGDRVLDGGCGFGDASQQLASLVGPKGEVIGADVSEPFVEAATAEAREAGAANLSFIAGDVQLMELPGPFDYIFSRMGI